MMREKKYKKETTRVSFLYFLAEARGCKFRAAASFGCRAKNEPWARILAFSREKV